MMRSGQGALADYNLRTARAHREVDEVLEEVNHWQQNHGDRGRVDELFSIDHLEGQVGWGALMQQHNASAAWRLWTRHEGEVLQMSQKQQVLSAGATKAPERMGLFDERVREMETAVSRDPGGSAEGDIDRLQRSSCAQRGATYRR